jgi:N-methylhydantoinase A
MAFRVTVDSGGTFTDVVLIDEQGNVLAEKAHTTPQDLTIGTMAGIAKVARKADISVKELLSRTSTIVHGTTQATNLIATRSGAKLGTITTKGYRDRITFLHVPKADMKGEIKQPAASLFDFNMDYPEPLTPRWLMTEVEERVNFDGKVHLPLNEDDVHKVVAYLKKEKVESIAVTLLFSHLYPHHERRVAGIIREDFPECHVSLSHQVLPMLGEVGRWSTTMFDAYIAPAIRQYAVKIQDLLRQSGFKGQLVFMQGNGGVATPEIICETPSHLCFSGPAAGPSMAVALGKLHHISNIVSVDMGGTSFDAAVIPEGQINVVHKMVIDGKKFSLPTVDVSAIGAGGGSIAWIDLSGRLQVGPQSAGGAPGPACYGIGGEEPTVSDADVVLGYIDPEYFLGGETTLRKDLAEKAIREKIAGPLNISTVEAAAAVYDVINSKMANNLEVVFSRRGYDPRDFLFITAGGAGAVHAARIQEEMRFTSFMIPKMAPVYCAFGMLYADLKHDFLCPYIAHSAAADLKTINDAYAKMEAQARDVLKREGVAEEDITIEKGMDIRYYGQVREQNAHAPAGPITPETFKMTHDRFHEKHKKVIGYADPDYPTEVVRLHLSGIARVPRPVIKTIEQGGADASKAIKATRMAYFREFKDYAEVNVYDGDKVLAGNILPGPCIIEERMTTIVVPPSMKMRVDECGNYIKVKED